MSPSEDRSVRSDPSRTLGASEPGEVIEESGRSVE